MIWHQTHNVQPQCATQREISSRCSEVKSVRAPLTLDAQSKWARTMGAFFMCERRGPRADADAHAGAGANAPMPRHRHAITGSRTSRSACLSLQRARRTVLDARTSLFQGTILDARTSYARCRRGEVELLIACGDSLERSVVSAACFQSFAHGCPVLWCIGHGSRRRGQSVLEFAREHGITAGAARTAGLAPLASLAARASSRACDSTRRMARPPRPNEGGGRLRGVAHDAAPATLLVPARLGLRLAHAPAHADCRRGGSLTPAFPFASLHSVARPPANRPAGLPLHFVPFRCRKPPETGTDDARCARTLARVVFDANRGWTATPL